MHPIENQPECHQCHDPGQRINGLLLTDLSVAPIEATLALDLRDTLAWWVGTVLVTAVIANLAVSQRVLRRLSGLAKAIKNVAQNGLTAELPETPADEIGRLSAAFNAMARQIEKRDRENVSLSNALRERVQERGELLERLIAAQEEERKRVARELHDDLGQSLSSTALSVEIAERAIDGDPDSAIQHLQQAHASIADAADRMYDLILGLRPSVLDDLGLVAATRAHGERMLDPQGISFEIAAPGMAERLPPILETALFRIFQEAISNILRHADAISVRVKIALDDQVVVAEVLDDGVGFDPNLYQISEGDGRGLGILGMRERAMLLGGQVVIDSEIGKGSNIRVRIPLNDLQEG
jgi:two-component system sensor histidine kinase UhpB